MRGKNRVRDRIRRRGRALVAASLVLAAGTARADDYGAAGDGSWGTPSTWAVVGGGNPSSLVPGSGDDAYIGVGSETGSVGWAQTANVTLDADQSVDNLTLGWGTGGVGTLSLGGHALTATSLSIGEAYSGATGGTGTVDESGGGSFQVQTLSVNGANSLTMGASDAATSVWVTNGASVATTSATNLGAAGTYTAANAVVSGGTLTLGADMDLTNSWYGSAVSVNDGGTIDAQGHAITADQVTLGSGAGDAWTLANRGALSVQDLSVQSGVFTLGATDSIGSSLSVAGDGKVVLGASPSSNWYVSVDQSGTLDSQGQNLNVQSLNLGATGTGWSLDNRGTITTNSLSVSNGSFTFGASDSTQNLTVGSGGVVTTTATGNVVSPYWYANATVNNGGELKLGADLNLGQATYDWYGGQLTINGGGTVDAQGHAITATTVSLGRDAGGWALDNRGTVTTSFLNVANGSFALASGDSVSQGIDVGSGGTVKAFGDLNLGNSLSLHDGGTLDLTGGLNVQAKQVDLGAGGWNLVDRGSIQTWNLSVQAGTFNYGAVSGDSVSRFLDVGQMGTFVNQTGAALALGNGLSLHDGGVLDLAGQGLSATSVNLGAGGWSLLNRGAIQTQYLSVQAGEFDLGAVAGDSVSQNLDVGQGGTFRNQTGAALTLGGVLGVHDGGTLDMGGQGVVADSVTLGTYWSPGGWTIQNQGTITTQSLDVYGGTLGLQAGDSTNSLGVHNGASVSTAAVGNVTGGASVDGAGSVLTLGADLNATGSLSVDAGTLNAQGHDVTVDTLALGQNGGGWTFSNRGVVTAQTINVAGGEFDMGASDTVSRSVDVGSGGTFQVASGHDLTLTGTLSVHDGGVLNAAGGNVTANDVELGTSGSGGWSLNNYGVLTTANLGVAQGTLDLKPTDVVSANMTIGGGGTVGMGSDMTLTGTVQVGNPYAASGTATLDMGGHALNANTLSLGGYYYYSQPWAIQNQGAITVANLNINGPSADSSPLTLHAGDQVGVVSLQSGSSLTTSTDSNVTNSVYVQGSTLTMGADLKLTGSLSVDGSSYYGAGATLDMGGHEIQANSVYLTNYNGGSLTVANQGTLDVGTLQLQGNVGLALGAADRIGNLGLSGGASATTADVANVSQSVDVQGSSLTLGANLAVSGSVTLQNSASVNAVMDMGGHSLSADSMTLGSSWSPGGWSIANQGTLALGSLYVSGGTLGLGASDAVGNLSAGSGATVSTSAVGNLTQSASVDGAGTSLTLGANASLSGSLFVTNGGIVNAQGHDVSASSVYVGSGGSAAAVLENLGVLTTGNLFLGNGSTLSLTSGQDVVGNQIYLSGPGVSLAVTQALGQTTGLTLNGTSASALTFDPAPTMTLDFAADAATNHAWIFRWLDAGGSNWISQIQSYIAGGSILVNTTDYQVYDLNGYTYVGYAGAPPAVPEPSSLVLAALGAAAVLGWRARRGRVG